MPIKNSLLSKITIVRKDNSIEIVPSLLETYKVLPGLSQTYFKPQLQLLCMQFS